MNIPRTPNQTPRLLAATLLLGLSQLAATPALASGACKTDDKPAQTPPEPKVELETALTAYPDCKLLLEHWELTSQGLRGYQRLLAKEEAKHGEGNCPGAKQAIDRIQRGRTILRQVAQVRGCQLTGN